MKKLVIALFTAIFLVLVGCAASGPKLADSAEDIAGTWHSTTSTTEVQINEDGTFRGRDTSGEGRISNFEFWFEGTQFFIQAAVSCDVGNPIGIYEVELLENGNLKWTVIEDECLTRVNYYAGRLIEVEWEPVP